MNYIGHHEVAVRYDPIASFDFLFGSCATDFARMAGTRGVFHDVTNPDLQSGIRLHKQTNKPAFDDQPAMQQLETNLEGQFTEFLAPRVARQASRVSKDLLFDGFLVNNTQVLDNLHATLGMVLEGEVDLGNADTAALMNTVRPIYENGPPRYDDVEVVAQRLMVVLGKTRTPIHAEQLPNVIDVLGVVQPQVLAQGPSTLSHTVDWLIANFEN